MGIELPDRPAEVTSEMKVRTSFPSYSEQVQGAAYGVRAKEALDASSHPQYIYFPEKLGPVDGVGDEHRCRVTQASGFAEP